MTIDWKLTGATFAAVFIAELGDKTQLATFSFASSGQSRLSVFVGSALALVATSAIAVVGGAKRSLASFRRWSFNGWRGWRSCSSEPGCWSSRGAAEGSGGRARRVRPDGLNEVLHQGRVVIGAGFGDGAGPAGGAGQ